MSNWSTEIYQWDLKKTNYLKPKIKLSKSSNVTHVRINAQRN